MFLPVREAREGALEKRMESQNKTFLVIAIIAVSIFTILVVTYLLTLRFRQPFKSIRNAQKSSEDKLPSLFSWKNFGKRPRRHDYSTSLQDTSYRGSGSISAASREMSGAADPERQTSSANAAGVDRNTSVRSVMTLPAYAPVARENERVLAREGERAGMDNVIELPETVDEEERQREDEMESLYQIRLARRVEAADREARRQARREARARGDVQALADIRRRAEEAADLSVSQMLIVEHQSRTRSREQRVPSVAYGDLGVARHDGTRIRANSAESDNQPLLNSAASMSGLSGRSRANTGNTLDLTSTHQRGLSITSINSRASSDFDFSDAPRSNSQSNGNNEGFEVVSLNPGQSHSGSRVPTPSIDIPREEAPAYEDPPNYESPVATGAPQLPHLERLPSIQVTTESSPVDGRSYR